MFDELHPDSVKDRSAREEAPSIARGLVPTRWTAVRNVNGVRRQCRSKRRSSARPRARQARRREARRSLDVERRYQVLPTVVGGFPVYGAADVYRRSRATNAWSLRSRDLRVERRVVSVQDPRESGIRKTVKDQCTARVARRLHVDVRELVVGERVDGVIR